MNDPDDPESGTVAPSWDVTWDAVPSDVDGYETIYAGTATGGGGMQVGENDWYYLLDANLSFPLICAEAR